MPEFGILAVEVALIPVHPRVCLRHGIPQVPSGFFSTDRTQVITPKQSAKALHSIGLPPSGKSAQLSLPAPALYLTFFREVKRQYFTAGA